MRKLSGLFIVTVVMFAFQNCGKVAFEAVDSGLSKSGFVEGPPISEVIVDNGGNEIVEQEDDQDDVIIIVEDKRDDGKKDEEKNDGDKKDEVLVVDDKDDDKKEDDKSEDKDDQVADRVDEDGDDKHEDNLTNLELDMIACSTDASLNSRKVLICHIPPGNPAARKTICISRNALNSHADHHGDTMGACGDLEVAGAE